MKLISIYIQSQNAESGPPLGTVLGNFGINSVKFCKEFNEFTNELPSYIKVSVTLFVEEDKSYVFTVKGPSIGFLLSILKKEQVVKNVDGSTTTFYVITIEDFLKICKFKFPLLDLKVSVPIVLGTIRGSGISII
jgi:large subunit ribosomal protein L11